ncbi:hypothetical protein [Paenibacillus hamazuiensis]|uniref:hypothetical protein n=1 Tax=Paenibacillus hamazuiensis TaxID=2936508 RepID=UPI00200BC2CA|nr:hypothetical protein [Paenibacillus hamazuiensis]
MGKSGAAQQLFSTRYVKIRLFAKTFVLREPPMITFFFWPFMILSILISILGLIFNKHRLLYVSAALIIPLSLYLAATPAFELWGLIFPFFYIGSALYIKKGKRIIALFLNSPNYFIIGWLGYVVLNQ